MRLGKWQHRDIEGRFAVPPCSDGVIQAACARNRLAEVLNAPLDKPGSATREEVAWALQVIREQPEWALPVLRGQGL